MQAAEAANARAAHNAFIFCRVWCNRAARLSIDMFRGTGLCGLCLRRMRQIEMIERSRPMRKLAVAAIVIAALSLSACVKKEASTSNDKEFTLGLVQKNIKVGMSQADVAEAIGSPNIVTKDSGGLETWIYDKIASEASYHEGGGYWTLILVGQSYGSGGSRTSQKTLTVVIKFDKGSRVEKVTYHASRF
jgi:outer membrane protein assembly factor BamE (lipoprotein component of BamABCDE complex)